MGKSEVEITVDLAKVRFDADGNGTVGEDEKLIAVIARIFGIDTADMQQGPIVIAFDRGDASWLRGYSNVLLAFTEFLLAYDWHESFDDSFHLFFPRVESPFSSVLAHGSGDSMSDWASPFADVISFVHIRWPLAEPARMAAVREHLKTVTATSRETWSFIAAETDDNHEWLPNALQTPPFNMPKISATQIAAWQGVLDEVDLILDGKKLVPHWRLTKGINLRRVFDEPQPSTWSCGSPVPLRCPISRMDRRRAARSGTGSPQPSRAASAATRSGSTDRRHRTRPETADPPGLPPAGGVASQRGA